MIGLSVSFYIRAMALGEIDPVDVEKIVGATCAPMKEDLEFLVKSYRETYWYGLEEQAEGLFWKFWAEGKIYQPRITDGWIPDQSGGIWVSHESEIRKIPYNNSY